MVKVVVSVHFHQLYHLNDLFIDGDTFGRLLSQRFKFVRVAFEEEAIEGSILLQSKANTITLAVLLHTA